jgi:hypothetical protein
MEKMELFLNLLPKILDTRKRKYEKIRENTRKYEKKKINPKFTKMATNAKGNNQYFFILHIWKEH